MKVKDLFLPLLLGGAALFAYDRFKVAEIEPSEARATSTTLSEVGPTEGDRSRREVRPVAPVSRAEMAQFKCDGRTHCSQMTSCAEAAYFVQHCPNTKMDGNGDGEPCEQQWCN